MKRKITRAQLRRLLLREVRLLNEQPGKPAGDLRNQKFGDEYKKRMEREQPPGKAFGGVLDDPGQRKFMMNMDNAIFHTFYMISEAIASLQDQISKLEAKQIGKEVGMDPDDPGA